jgi:hypothetical protein
MTTIVEVRLRPAEVYKPFPGLILVMWRMFHDEAEQRFKLPFDTSAKMLDRVYIMREIYQGIDRIIADGDNSEEQRAWFLVLL